MDIAKFIATDFTPRTFEMKVPELKEWFPGDENPVWVVRGLTAAELARATDLSSVESMEKLTALVEAIAGEGDTAAKIREAMGISRDEIPRDTSRRIEQLVIGSVSPALSLDTRDVAVKLAEAFPITFLNLTTKIQSLSGQGSEPGKRKRSGKTRESDSQ